MRIVALLVLVLSLSGCGNSPEHEVVSVAFGLAPAANLILPSTSELGRTLTATELAGAGGRLDANVPAGALTIGIEKLPPIATSLSGPYYRFILLVGDEPIVPQSSGAAGKLLGRIFRTPSCFAHGDPARVDLGRVTPDPIGGARLTATSAGVDLSYVVGGEVEIVIPLPLGDLKTYTILEGEVGNLADEGSGGAPVSGDTGHHH